MRVKAYEVRDRMTFIPVVAIRLGSADASVDGVVNSPVEVRRETWLATRAGYGLDPQHQTEYVLLGRLDGSGYLRCDPHDWGDRTMQTVHQYLVGMFDRLPSGSVIDVEWLLGETSVPKITEEDDSWLI